MNDPKACIAYLYELYPAAVDRWPSARVQAFRDQIAPLPITVEQFRAVASSVAMNTKGVWAPPEHELLRKLRGVAESNSQARIIEGTRQVARADPNTRTVQEWGAWFLDDPRRQDDLTDMQLKGLAMLGGSRERRIENERKRAVKA